MHTRLSRLLFALSLLLTSYAAAQSNSPSVRCKDIPELAGQVSRLRGLRIRAPIKCIELTRNEYLALKEKNYQANENPNRLTAEEYVYQQIGLIPLSFPYRDCLSKSYSQDLIASYDSESRAILLPIDSIVNTAILAHEIVHALQDQSFALKRMQNKANRFSDTALALAALVEGDALLIQEHFSISHPNDALAAQSESQAKCTTPPSIGLQFDFPYDFGPLYVGRLVDNIGWRGVDQELANPPKCSSRILHKNYRRSDCPDPNKLDISHTERSWIKQRLPGIIRKEYSDSLGEYILGLMLTPEVGREGAILAAKGWSGDSVSLWRNQNNHAVSLTTQWQSAKEASEFAHALTISIAKRFNVPIEPQVQFWEISTSATTIRVSAKGRRVGATFVGAT